MHEADYTGFIAQVYLFNNCSFINCRYLGSGGGACQKPLKIKTHRTEIDLHFYRDKETKKNLLCKLPLERKEETIEPPQENFQETNGPKRFTISSS